MNKIKIGRAQRRISKERNSLIEYINERLLSIRLDAMRSVGKRWSAKNRHGRRPVSMLLALALTVSLPLVLPSPDALPLSSDVPESEVKTPALIKEESVSTYIASEVAPGDGIALNIILPEKPRYKDGAPVCVVVPGGDGPSGLTFTMHSAQVGFLEIRFAFPGGGYKGFMSSGIADYRGEASQTALKDVLLFAAGKTKDTMGRSLSDLVSMPVAKNVGAAGWSNGGNILLVTMARYASDLGFISWIAFYESPVGSLFFPPNLGGVDDLFLNQHYRQGSAATGKCLLDFKGLSYDATAVRHPGMHKKMSEPELKGVVYYDDNRNHHWDESSEFAFSYLLDVGLEKQIYPPQLVAALSSSHLFDTWVAAEDTKGGNKKGGGQAGRYGSGLLGSKGGKSKKPLGKPQLQVVWPEHLATEREAQSYYLRRDGSVYIGMVLSKFPNLLVTVVGTRVDHLQKQPDHPHIISLYNALLTNKALFLRLNPEPVYVAAIAAMHTGNFANNAPNQFVDDSTIDHFLEPEGTTRDYVFMDAAVAELADRLRTKKFDSPLEKVLIPYTNSKSQPPQPQPKEDAGKKPAEAK